MTVATRVSGPAPLARATRREDRHDLVAVDLGAGPVDGEAPVGVAVVRDAEVGAAARQDRLAQPLEVGRAVAVVDVEPVGRGADHRHVGRRRGGTPRARRPTPRRSPRRARRGARPGGWAAAARGARRTARARRAGGGPARRRRRWAAATARASAPRCVSSTSSASLWPPRAKNLIPLSGIGLCDAESITPRSAPEVGREERDGRCRQHSGVEDVDAGRGQPGHGGREQELTRSASGRVRRRRSGRWPSNAPASPST